MIPGNPEPFVKKLKFLSFAKFLLRNKIKFEERSPKDEKGVLTPVLTPGQANVSKLLILLPVWEQVCIPPGSLISLFNSLEWKMMKIPG